MSTVDETVQRARRADVAFVAASVAYYWLLSLVPTFVLAFFALQVAYGNVLGEWLAAQLAPALSPSGQEFVRGLLADTTGSVVIAFTGVVALAFSWMRLYRALERAFDRVYDDDRREGLPARAFAAAVVVPGISVGVVLTAAGVSTVGPGLLWQGLQICGVALALFPAFVTLPPSRPKLAAAIMGATTTALAWSGLRVAFDLYATFGSYSLAYGLFGGGILVVTFLYLGAVSLLFSVSLSATLDD